MTDEDGNQITIGEIHDLPEHLGTLPIISTQRDQVQAVLTEQTDMVGGTKG